MTAKRKTLTKTGSKILNSEDLKKAASVALIAGLSAALFAFVEEMFPEINKS